MGPQKCREVSKFMYNYIMVIYNLNGHPDFVEGLDGQAKKKRLKVFETKSSKRKDTSVTDKLHFFMINQYISEVDLGHPQHVR